MWRAAAFLRQRKYCQIKPWYVLYHSKLQPIHWSVSATNYTGDRLPSAQPSAESVCNSVMLPGSPSTTRLPNPLHPAVWLVTQSLLQLENLHTASLCLDHLHIHHWESPAESTPRNGRSSTGQRRAAQQPLSSSPVKQEVQWLTWKDMQKKTVLAFPLLKLQWC